MRKGIIAAGNWIIDQVKTIDRWPREGELCNILSVEQSGGGGPCNVLFDLAALTGRIPLYAAGALGDDDNGLWLQHECDRRKIDRRYLQCRPGQVTSFTDVMSGDGRRTFFHCCGANAGLGYPELAAIEVEAGIFYLGYLLLLAKLDGRDPDYGTPAARLLDDFRRRGCLTVVDFVSEAPEKFHRVVNAALPHIDVLVVNELEAGNTFGVAVRDADNGLIPGALRAVARRFLAAGVRQGVVIHMPEGAVVLTADGDFFCRPSCDVPRREIVGTNGAGDAFCAGILYGLHEGLCWEETLRLASASAAFNLKHATANGGAVELAVLQRYLQDCPWSPAFPA